MLSAIMMVMSEGWSSHFQLSNQAGLFYLEKSEVVFYCENSEVVFYFENPVAGFILKTIHLCLICVEMMTLRPTVAPEIYRN